VSGCVFCEIVAGTAPASVVHADDLAVAFLDARPVTPGHLLVVPRRHAADLAGLDDGTGEWLFRVGMRLAAALRRSGLRCEGVTLFLADGEAAGQEVFHVHLHIFPRYDGDRFRIEADWSSMPDRVELDRIAALIRGGGR
jgi:diadenosine tetraphosphate (Ap4A) HIT family hydrolase